MKKIFALLLVFVLAFTLVACGGNDTSDVPGNDESQSQSQENESTEATDSTNSTENTEATENTENTEKKVINDGSKLGVLQPVAEQQDFVINGLYISSESGQHEYTNIDAVDTFGIDGLNSEFELNEWLGIYVDTDSNASMSIYFVRNDANADYSKITEGELETICSEKEYPVIADAVPDAENRGYIGRAYVHPESSEPDLFNVFFVANGQVCYMVQLNIIAENSAA